MLVLLECLDLKLTLTLVTDDAVLCYVQTMLTIVFLPQKQHAHDATNL